MKPENTSPPDANEEIAALIETLHQSEQRLEELTAGEVDTVSNRAGRTLMLQRAQVELRVSESAKQTAILNALPAHIGLLDAQGRIISVNETWRRFASANAMLSLDYGTGLNYLEICDSATGDNATEARQAAAGIRSVLAGTVKDFSLEYPCHSPTEQRWFLMTVTPLTDDRPNGAVVMHLNITERKQSENALLESKKFLQLVVENVPLRIFWKDRDLQYLGCNTQFAKDAGYSRPDELTSKNDFDMGWKDQAELYRCDDKAVLESSKPKLDIEEPQTTREGNIIWLSTSKVPMRDKDNQIIGILGFYQDITERKQAELARRESERRFSDLLGNVELVSVMCDREAHITYCNEYMLQLSGWHHEEVIGKNWFNIFIPPEIIEQKRELFAALLLDNPEAQHHESEMLTRSGERRLIRWNNSVLRSAAGEVIGTASIGEDITERIQGEQRLVHLAHYDSLTGLPNRMLFNDRLNQVIAQAARNNWITAVMFIDLDEFKMVNDTLGHMMGDKLLQVVSERLSGCLRNADTLARFGGDEFAIILTNLSQAEDAGLVGMKLMAALAEPIKLDDNEAFVTCSIGISLCPADATAPDVLLRNADTAMYRAKEMGRNDYQFYVPAMNARVQEKATLSNSLRRALERDELFLHYQPQLDLKSGQIVGVEALVRWNHPIQGVVPPGKFIPIAEETGLIVAIGEWVLRTACAQNKAWQDAGLPAIEISVNLSARQFGQNDVVALVKKVLDDTGLDGRYLELELTESMVMDRGEEFIKILNQLRTLNVHLSIDDFGTGYSNLSYLERFPLDTLKIDRLFVKDIGGGGDNGKIAIAVIHLAHSLGFNVIAEGVETDVQLGFLRNHGCDAIQGYYFSRPIPADDFAALLKHHEPVPAK